MDGNRFDALTKSLAIPRTRRGVLKTLGAGLAAGLGALGIGGVGAAPGGQGKGKGAQCGGPGKQCKRNAQCCEFAGLVCYDGRCSCPVNTCQSGACHGACPEGKVFDAGTCSCVCPENTCATTGACMPACGEGMTFNADECACACDEDHCCQCLDIATNQPPILVACVATTYEGCAGECAAREADAYSNGNCNS